MDRLVASPASDQATRTLNEVVRDDPNDFRAWHNLAAIAYTRGDLDEAERLERKAVAIAPDYAEAWNTPGAIALVRKRTGDAVEALERASRLAPQNGQVFRNLSLAFQHAGKLDAARTAEYFGRYIGLSGQTITRAQAQERMFGKLARANFHTDMRPLLPADRAELLTPESTKASFIRVSDNFIDRIPGEPWARTDEMKKRFGLVS